MRNLSAAIIFFCACVTLSARAQHGGSHGGGGGHASSSGHFSAQSSGFHSAPAPRALSGFRGGFSSPSRYAGPPQRFAPSRPAMPTSFRSPYRNPNLTRPASPIYSSGNDHFRQPYRGSGGEGDHRHRHGYGFAYWNSPYAIPFLYPYNGWLDSGFYDDYADNSSYDNYVTNPYYQGYDDTQDASGYAPPYPDQDGDPSAYNSPDSRYSPRPEYSSPSAISSQPSVTIVFKDGRPTQQIHNYMLSRNTLTILDQGRHDIPIDQLDLPATERANRDTGVEFHLPTVD